MSGISRTPAGLPAGAPVEPSPKKSGPKQLKIGRLVGYSATNVKYVAS